MKLNLCEVQKIAHRQRWPLNPGHSLNSCVSGTSMGLVLWTSFLHHPSGYWTATKTGFNLDTFFFSHILSSKTHTMDWYYKFDIQFFLPSTPTYNFCYTKKWWKSKWNEDQMMENTQLLLLSFFWSCEILWGSMYKFLISEHNLLVFCLGNSPLCPCVLGSYPFSIHWDI